jgi:transcriptional regulator with XRE-family HTH domain
MSMSERDGLFGAALTVLRGGRSQKALADDMRLKGHKWSQATVWSVEKGERRLLLSEAEDLASVLGCDVADLLKPPSELGLEADIAQTCRRIREEYESVVWHASQLLAAHDDLQAKVQEAKESKTAYSVLTASRLDVARRARTVKTALGEAQMFNDVWAEGERPATREQFDAQRRRAGEDDGEYL